MALRGFYCESYNVVGYAIQAVVVDKIGVVLGFMVRRFKTSSDCDSGNAGLGERLGVGGGKERLLERN